MGNTLSTIVISVLVFGALIFIHELGHFLAAKWAGIRVNEFSLGMGPVIFQRQEGETAYSLRAFPIGGFVSMEGEDDGSNDERAFCNKSVGKRFLVISAGAMMNLLLGFLLMILLVCMGNAVGTTQISQFGEGAVSSQWLQVDDEIVSVNGHRVRTPNDISYEFMNEDDGVLDMEVIRDGEKINLSGVTFDMQDIGDGLKAIRIDFKVYGVQKTIWNVPPYAFNWSVSIMKQVWSSLIKMVTGQFTLNQLSGPVGVASTIGEAASMGLDSTILIIAFITINLGVFNLLPFPALDGGRLFFLLIEMIRRKPIKPEYEGYVNTAGLLILLGLMAMVTFNDVIKLIFR
ncbi:site-2 protease family protein [Phocea massiliensis]|uniref:Regulator of sigma-W protease RasP n=1 Tax=uncultured Anaerotruncus sp. TaxID=905011 RepID=A0A6N2SE01_9FIRM|nr:site-2 protease family protein [Merdimmobilis hominis]MCD4836248.1 site-2 protease family protein [Merdimmobilis hominis]